MATKQLSMFESDCRFLKLKGDLVRFRMRANSRIKRGRLLVCPEEGLVVETPKTPSLQQARKMIYRRKEWVIDALEILRQKRSQAQQIKRQQNSILVMGKEKSVRVRTNIARDYILETAEDITVGLVDAEVIPMRVQKILANWLRQRATKYIPLRVQKLSAGRFKFGDIRIKNHRTLWGSCSSQGNLNFNWRLIMAPRFVSDYIFFHELCHTRYLNHSKAYWKLVEDLCPNYERAEKWLRDYGFVLNL